MLDYPDWCYRGDGQLKARWRGRTPPREERTREQNFCRACGAATSKHRTGLCYDCRLFGPMEVEVVDMGEYR